MPEASIRSVSWLSVNDLARGAFEFAVPDHVLRGSPFLSGDLRRVHLKELRRSGPSILELFTAWLSFQSSQHAHTHRVRFSHQKTLLHVIKVFSSCLLDSCCSSIQERPSSFHLKSSLPAGFSFLDYYYDPCDWKLHGIKSIEKQCAVLISPGQRISAFSLPACHCSESSLMSSLLLDKQDFLNRPCALTQGSLCDPAGDATPIGSHQRSPVYTHLALPRFRAAHALLEPLEVGQAHLFPLQHSLGPSELLMSGSLPCKLQNENTANKKGHRILSTHLLLT